MVTSLRNYTSPQTSKPDAALNLQSDRRPGVARLGECCSDGCSIFWALTLTKPPPLPGWRSAVPLRLRLGLRRCCCVGGRYSVPPRSTEGCRHGNYTPCRDRVEGQSPGMRQNSAVTQQHFVADADIARVNPSSRGFWHRPERSANVREWAGSPGHRPGQPRRGGAGWPQSAHPPRLSWPIAHHGPSRMY